MAQTQYEIYKMNRAEGEHLPADKKLKYEHEADNKGATIYDFSKWQRSEKIETLMYMIVIVFFGLIMFLLGFVEGISSVIV